MPPLDLNPDQKRALSEAITQHAITGDIAKPVIEYLFKESLRKGDKPKEPTDNISEHHIIQGVTECRGSNEGAIRTLISRMRKQLTDFFAHHPVGRQQRFLVLIPNTDYTLQFEENHPPPITRELVQSFWAPYYISRQPVRIFYPEPPFFVDDHEAAHYHRLAVSPQTAKKYFNSKEGLSQDYPFVSAGIFQAVAALQDCFQRSPRVPTSVSPLRAKDRVPEQDEDIILLGHISALPQISEFELGCVIRSQNDKIEYRPKNGPSKIFADEHYSPSSGDLLTTWGLVTRNARRFEGKFITIIAAASGVAVEAITTCLTRQSELKTLAETFGITDIYPDTFQILFQIALVNQPSDAKVHKIAPAIAVTTDRRI